MGKEWRPLGEKDKYGRPNPFQDPQRGRIQIITTIQEATAQLGIGKRGVTPIDGTNLQNNILINLSGPTSIMGRGLKVFEQTGDTNANKIDDGLDKGNFNFETGYAIQACCVIGEDKPPTTMMHHHYGYGGYGHGGYGHGSPSYGGHGHGHGYSHSSYRKSDPVSYSGSHGHIHKSDHLQPASVKAGINDWFGGRSFFNNVGKPEAKYSTRRYGSHRY